MSRKALLTLALTAFAALLLPDSLLASEADALAIDANIQAIHLPYGTILDPVFASTTSTQITGYTRCGDSALWTGNYLAAESFRFAVTQDAAALSNVKSALAGLQSLVDVTGHGYLARCAFPANSPYAAGISSEESSNGVFHNGSQVWIGNTSRDQYSGVLFGLVNAYDLVNDPGVHTSSANLISQLVGNLSDNNWTIFFPDFIPFVQDHVLTYALRQDQELAALQIARHVNPARFGTIYAQQSAASLASVATPIGFDTLSDNSYFKFNLDSINLYSLIRLDSGAEDSTYRAAYAALRAHTASQQNAFFNMIDRALNGPDVTRDQQTLVMLDQWLARPRRDVYVDLSGAVPVCGAQACSPVPVNLRPPTDFLWQRSPYQLAGGGQGLVEGAGIDYILPYWMARYYGLYGQFSVQSAAASNLNVAPSGLASIFGSNLALGTQPATSLDLPLNLAGDMVTITDSAHVTRTAQLLYVSPGQINLLLPAGIAPGIATLGVIDPGQPQQSSTVNVQNVAPALFSAAASGHGVAAATAVRVPSNSPAMQTSVPVFQCAGPLCTSTPIALDTASTVYVTLYGTGIRNRSSLSNVTVTVNGVSVPVQYASAQPVFAGLDQINIALPASLKGAGEAGVIVTVDGIASNAVTLNIQ